MKYVSLFVAVSFFCDGSAETLKPQLEQPCFFSSEVDYLLWFVNEDSLSYTTIANTTLPVSNETSLSERDKFLKPGWNSGVRGLLGLVFSNWDTQLSYVYYYAKADGHSSAFSESIPSSSLDAFAGTIVFDPSSYQLFQDFPGHMEADVSANWDLHFNRADLEFGSKFFIGKRIHFRPFFGVEGLFVHQKLKGNTNTVFQSLDTGFPVIDRIQTDNKNRFAAIGGKVGFNSVFCLGYGFDLYGSFSGSILWGQFKIDQMYEQQDFYLAGEAVLLGKESIDHTHHASVFNFDLGLGFTWKYSFLQGRYEFGSKLGWEQHFYSNMNRYQNFYVSEIDLNNAVYAFDRNLQKGNLTLSGFVFGVSFLY